MFWPQLVGAIEIEERRPRYWNEPRRKRLNFVKDRAYDSGEWALVNPSFGHHSRQSEQQLWDRRQWEANQRFIIQEDQRFRQREARLQQDRERWMLLHPVPRPPLESWQPQQQDPRILQMPPVPPRHPNSHDMEERRSHYDHGDDDIVAGVSDSSETDDSRHPSLRLIEAVPKAKLPKHFKKKRSKSRGRKDKRIKRSSLLSSDDSGSDNDDFIRGYMAAKESSPRRPLSRRGRSRSRLFELSDDSFEDLEPRRPSRSRSRGPRNSKWVSDRRRR